MEQEGLWEWKGSGCSWQPDRLQQGKGRRHCPAGLICACPALVKPRAHPGSSYSSLSQSILSQFEFSQPQPLSPRFSLPPFPPVTRQTPRHLLSEHPHHSGFRKTRKYEALVPGHWRWVSQIGGVGLLIPSEGRLEGRLCSVDGVDLFLLAAPSEGKPHTREYTTQKASEYQTTADHVHLSSSQSS